MHIIGNDIVDLEIVSKDKYKDTKFLNKVYSSVEQKLILTADDKNQMLWILWAAKETAYKIVSKLQKPPIFEFKNFKIELLALDNNKAKLRANYQDLISCNLTANIYKQKIHVIGYYQDPKYTNIKILENNFKIRKITKEDQKNWEDRLILEKFFSKRELESIFHIASAAVRYDIKRYLQEHLEFDFADIEIIRNSINFKMYPPYVLYKSKDITANISISHHGSWLAWGISH